MSNIYNSDSTADILIMVSCLILAILFGGEPDLMDGIITWLGSGS